MEGSIGKRAALILESKFPRKSGEIREIRHIGRHFKIKFI